MSYSVQLQLFDVVQMAALRNRSHGWHFLSKLPIGSMSTICGPSSQMPMQSSNIFQQSNIRPSGMWSQHLKNFRQAGKRSRLIPSITYTILLLTVALLRSESIIISLMINRSTFWHLVSLTGFCCILILIILTVLHPYYKLDYIKMAWGGAEEQEQQLVAGDHNVKNWHDEALKVVEHAMWDYWKEAQEESHCRPVTHKQSTPASHSSPTDSTTLESTYDHHRHGIMERATCENSASLGWAAELRRYTSMVIEDASKDMDIISWWAVSIIMHSAPCILLT